MLYEVITVLGGLAGAGIGTGIEADDDRLRCLAEIDVGFADCTNRRMDDINLDFSYNFV